MTDTTAHGKRLTNLIRARAAHPLRARTDMPHFFIVDGIWRVSLMPRRQGLSRGAWQKALMRWRRAYAWLGKMHALGRLP